VPALKLIQSAAPATPAMALSRELSAAELSAAAHGDGPATLRLVRCYQDRLLAFVSRMLGRDQQALVEDIAQETFLRVFRNLRGWKSDGPAQLSTWIFTIAARLCIDELRKRQRRGVVVDVEHAPGVAARADALAVARNLSHRVESALRQLSDDQRTVFVMRVIEELPEREVAAALQIDEGTVKSRLSRARAHLRVLLAEPAPEGRGTEDRGEAP
jgi:RNA polymerase sigma-70 factor, ECF subfamily